MDELIKLHLDGSLQLFFSNKIKKEDYDIYYSKIIADEYWNYAYLKKNQLDLKTIKNISLDMEQIDRKPVIYITSNILNKKLKQEINELNLELLYTDCWMCLNNLEKFTINKNTMDFSIFKVDNNLKDKFVKAVMDGFSGDNPEDPYNDLPEGYKISIEKSFNNDVNSITKINHYLGIKDNEPISTATVIYNANKAVIYNITTAKKYQKKGICKQMMFYLINELNKLNINEVCLQTEKGYYTEEVYKKIGFKEKFLGYAYFLKGDK